MAKEYKNTMKALSDKLNNEPIKTPIQEVRLVESAAASKKEAHINFWAPEDLVEQLKIYAVVSKKTIKQIGIEAFEQYLKNNKK